jgi:hypothetical protein
LDFLADQYSIESQVSYFKEDANKSRVDIVLSSNLSLIFIECKVDSPFNEYQLVHYRRILETAQRENTNNNGIIWLNLFIQI